MLREHPITTLLIVATVAGDLAAANAVDTLVADSGLVFLGLILGQAGCAAIWAATGETHRLARAGWFLLILGLLALVGARGDWGQWQNAIAVLGPYALIVIALIGCCRAAMLWHDRAQAASASVARWRFPVAELFGWTIIVALVCLITRNLEFIDLQSSGVPAALFLWAVTVVLAWLLLRGNFIEHLILRLIGLALAAFISASLIDTFDFLGQKPAGVVALGQVFYVAAWLAIRRIDQLQFYGKIEEVASR